MLDWDDIKVTVIDPEFVVTEDENVYSLKAEQRMIIFEGERGETGQQGEQGISATISLAPVVTLPAGSNAYAENLGDEHDAIIKFGIPRGENGAGAVWGDIDGTLANQTDLQTALDDKANATALDLKANISDLGGMAYINDAQSDNKQYSRKNGSWSALGSMAAADDVASDNTYYLRRNGAWTDADERYYTESEVDTLLAGKQDTPTDSGWITATPLQTGGVNRYSGTIRYRKIWRTVEIVAEDIQLTENLNYNSNINLCAIPSGYRPVYRVFGSGGFRSSTSSYTFHPFPVYVSTSVGVSGLPDGIGNNQYLTLHLIYMI